MTQHWEHFPHQADVGIRGTGPTPAAAFEQAALALAAVTLDPSAARPTETVELSCEAPDLELLLVDWLNALIGEAAIRHLVWHRFRVTLEGSTRLTGNAWGERADPRRQALGVEVKGATYTALAVRRGPGGEWLAQCVVDV